VSSAKRPSIRHRPAGLSRTGAKADTPDTDIDTAAEIREITRSLPRGPGDRDEEEGRLRHRQIAVAKTHWRPL
jgi:hypothetical protein